MLPADGEIKVRRARTGDVRAVTALVCGYARERILLDKEVVTYYESVQEFQVAVDAAGAVVGCGALHVIWEDLGEIRTLAVAEAWRGRGVGHRLLEALVAQAQGVGLARLFCLTFEVDFFARHGFTEIDGTPVAAEVYPELLRSYDEGIAEFLDLARVKPNTLGNSRMLREL